MEEWDQMGQIISLVIFGSIGVLAVAGVIVYMYKDDYPDILQ